MLIQIAISRTIPVMMGVRNGLTPSSVRPFAIIPVNTAPITVPTTVPRPPKRFVPPRTTAVMTVNSNPLAELAEPEPSRAAIRMPAMPAARPVNTSVIISTRRVLTPARRTDSTLDPMPVT